MWHERTSAAAKGKWKGILAELGIPASFLVPRNGPCPFCGGVDRFMFDNKEGKGSFICRQVCGAGDGMALAMLATGQNFAETAARIDGILGNIKPDSEGPKREMTDEEQKSRRMEVWRKSVPLTPGCVADRYFAARRLSLPEYPKTLRYCDALPDGEGGIRPALVAAVQDAGGTAVTLHRTFLDGKGGKAEMASPRKLMPGSGWEGASVRLAPVERVMGVAEGIETALAASRLFNIPVWACLTAGNMAKFIPPDGVEVVHIYGDNDESFTGQAAAYSLARLLKGKGAEVRVELPDEMGRDWADVWKETR